jgi:ribosome-binding factor A
LKSERPFERTDRVANEIHQILGKIQNQYINLSHLGFITFSKVIISPDLKHAKVFFGVVNEKKSIENIAIELNKKSKAFRKYLGQELTIKFTPSIKFFYDDSIMYVEKIDELFSQLNKKH